MKDDTTCNVNRGLRENRVTIKRSRFAGLFLAAALALASSVSFVSSQDNSGNPLNPQPKPAMVSSRPKAPPDVERFWADANSAARMLLWDTDNLTMVQGLVPTLELSLKLHLQYQGEEWQRVDAQRYLTDLQRLLTLGQDQRADLAKANLIRTKPLIDAGKFEEAIDAAQEKCRLVLEVLGPLHPDYLSSLEELGMSTKVHNAMRMLNINIERCWNWLKPLWVSTTLFIL